MTKDPTSATTNTIAMAHTVIPQQDFSTDSSILPRFFLQLGGPFFQARYNNGAGIGPPDKPSNRKCGRFVTNPTFQPCAQRIPATISIG